MIKNVELRFTEVQYKVQLKSNMEVYALSEHLILILLSGFLFN